MSDLAFLPRVLIAKSNYGTRFYWDRRLGLLACCGRTGVMRSIEPDELRRGYPAAWSAWLRFVALLPDGALNSRPGRVA